MKHAKHPGSINSLCGKPVKPYGRGSGRVQAIPATQCWNVAQAIPMARESKAEWCRKCLAVLLKSTKVVTVDYGGPDHTITVMAEIKDGLTTITDISVEPQAAPGLVQTAVGVEDALAKVAADVIAGGPE